MDMDIVDYYEPPSKEYTLRQNRKKKIKRLGAIFVLNKIIDSIKKR